MLKSQELTEEEKKMTPLERHLDAYQKFGKYGWPKAFSPPKVGTRVIPDGKTCGNCWNFTHGRKCGDGGPKLTSRQTNYCQYSGNYFSETPEIVLTPVTDEAYSELKQAGADVHFAGSKDELLLHSLLVRAKYQCECAGTICKKHAGRCTVMHKAAGGATVFLVQPKNFKKANSLENSQVMCVACAGECTLTKMSVPKKKRKTVENPDQQLII